MKTKYYVGEITPWGSNPRPHGYEASALPTDLLELCMQIYDHEISYCPPESKKCESKRISNSELSSARIHTSFIRLHQNAGDTFANGRIQWGVTIFLLSRKFQNEYSYPYEYEYSYSYEYVRAALH